MLTIGAIHSGATSLAPILEREWAPYLDDYKLINIIDDSLIHTVIRDGEVTSRTVRRVVDLCEALILAGAASLATTLAPTVSCVERTAQRLGREVEVESLVAEGAFGRWVAGEAEAHDDLLVEAAKSRLAGCEVILLAQVSMIRVQERMARETGKPVFASPGWCAKQICGMFAGKGA